MSEHLNDKEIALELTKVMVEHYNRRVDIKDNARHIDLDFVGKSYNYFHQIVSSVNKRKTR
ncbi:hypothetical protein SAMN04488558_103125 [Ignavigranum ruoffiae]|uniref:Uncharacterized protein n=1 Tax=Ignavigranum ruoffiae TaxID=89093 RepID=A0A1H9BW54_9LACT|nr:hypothetical protein [Ignavigranum ruoffiae]SEP93195.1 hypothetical protein SAMN04488558_103125 [Ignavigranum ruoffiae]